MDTRNSFRPINRIKLENYIIKNSSSRTSFCEKIGRSDSWLSESLRRGCMSVTDIMAIKGAYGIDIEDTTPKNEEDDVKSLLAQILIGVNKTNEYLSYLSIDIASINLSLDMLDENQKKIIAKQNQIQRPKACLPTHINTYTDHK